MIRTDISPQKLGYSNIFVPYSKNSVFSINNIIFFMMRKFVKEVFGWGLILWLIGYLLGIILFMFVPFSMIGWIIMPVGTIVTVWVLLKKITGDSFKYYLLLAVVWAVTAIVFDYIFLVKLFKPADGYYKLDVYLYYLLTFLLPLIIGWRETRQRTG